MVLRATCSGSREHVTRREASAARKRPQARHPGTVLVDPAEHARPSAVPRRATGRLMVKATRALVGTPLRETMSVKATPAPLRCSGPRKPSLILRHAAQPAPDRRQVRRTSNSESADQPADNRWPRRAPGRECRRHGHRRSQQHARVGGEKGAEPDAEGRGIDVVQQVQRRHEPECTAGDEHRAAAPPYGTPDSHQRRDLRHEAAGHQRHGFGRCRTCTHSLRQRRKTRTRPSPTPKRQRTEEERGQQIKGSRQPSVARLVWLRLVHDEELIVRGTHDGGPHGAAAATLSTY